MSTPLRNAWITTTAHTMTRTIPLVARTLTGKELCQRDLEFDRGLGDRKGARAG